MDLSRCDRAVRTGPQHAVNDRRLELRIPLQVWQTETLNPKP